MANDLYADLVYAEDFEAACDELEVPELESFREFLLAKMGDIQSQLANRNMIDAEGRRLDDRSFHSWRITAVRALNKTTQQARSVKTILRRKNEEENRRKAARSAEARMKVAESLGHATADRGAVESSASDALLVGYLRGIILRRIGLIQHNDPLSPREQDILEIANRRRESGVGQISGSAT